MKKILLMIMVVCCGLLLVGCNKEKAKKTDDNTKKEEKIKNEVVVDGDKVTIDGAIVKDLDVISVETIFNFSIIFDNSNNKAVKIDCSKISLKNGDSKYTLSFPDIKTIDENQSYTQYGLPINDSEKIKVGDEFDVYYGKTKIGTAKAIDR